MFGIHCGGVLSLPDRPGAIEPSVAITPTAEHPARPFQRRSPCALKPDFGSRVERRSAFSVVTTSKAHEFVHSLLRPMLGWHDILEQLSLLDYDLRQTTKLDETTSCIRPAEKSTSLRWTTGGPGGTMLLIQTRQAKRFRKYQILMGILFLLSGSLFPLLTMHWYNKPKRRS
jgi:hypothetical protein